MRSDPPKLGLFQMISRILHGVGSILEPPLGFSDVPTSVLAI
jgi:hypothetical protein